MLKISKLYCRIDNKTILNNLSVEVSKGSVVAIMGPNGSGKSTLAQVIAGNPAYKVEKGSILWNGKNIINSLPEERAHLGIFLSFQYPLEIPGVSVASFLRMVYNKKFGKSVSPVKFRDLLKEKMKLLNMKEEFMERYLNEGFSGGEKKRMEVLQMLVLEPSLVILDEVDSGLDVDALKSVAKGINYLRRKNPDTAFVIVTHHARILDLVKPDKVHVLLDGQIVESGALEIVTEIEKNGFKAEKSEFGHVAKLSKKDQIKK